MEQESIPQQVPYVPPPEQKKGSFLVLGIAEVIFLVILAVVIAGVLNYYNILPISSLNPTYFSWLPHEKINRPSQIAPQKNKYPPANNDYSSYLPIPPKDPLVKGLYINYALQGKVKEINPVGDKFQITLFSKNSHLPPLFITKGTKITKTPLAKEETLQAADIKSNDTVLVSVIYDTITKTWGVFLITILNKK